MCVFVDLLARIYLYVWWHRWYTYESTTNFNQPMNWAHDDTDVMPRYEFNVLTNFQCLCVCVCRTLDRQLAYVWVECVCLCVLCLFSVRHSIQMTLFICACMMLIRFICSALSFCVLLGESPRTRVPTWKRNVTSNQIEGSVAVKQSSIFGALSLCLCVCVCIDGCVVLCMCMCVCSYVCFFVWLSFYFSFSVLHTIYWRSCICICVKKLRRNT